MTATLTLDDAPKLTADRPLVELLRLSAPTVAQMSSYTVMQFIDTWMLARASAPSDVTPATAAATAGLVAFSVISLGMGVMFVVNTLVSQAFGKGDDRACGRVMWQGIWFAVAFSLALVPIAHLFPKVYAWAGHEHRMAGLESTYTKILLDATVLKLAATAVEQFLLGVNRPGAVALASFAAVTVNAVAAWAMVLGHWGFAPQGVAGSAIAQNIGSGVELLCTAGFAALPAVRTRFGAGDWRFRWGVMGPLLRMGVPSGVQIVADVLAWSAFSAWVMAPFGTAAMAANMFVFRYMSVSFMPAFGVSVAVTALVGRYIGAGLPNVAVARAHLGFVVTVIYMAVCGALLFAFREPLIRLFTSDPQAVQTGSTLLVFAAVYQLCDAVYIVYNGALRGAGDTLVPAVVLAVLCWGITVAGGRWVADAVPHWGPSGPWTTALVYGVVLGAFMVLRFERGRWRRAPVATSA